MGNRLRLRAPGGARAESAAGLARFIGIVARLVRTAAAQRQKVDEVLARRAWSADSTRGSGVSDFAPLRCTVCDTAAPVVVVATAVTEGGALESSARVGAVCGVIACAGAARTAARGVADTVRI